MHKRAETRSCIRRVEARETKVIPLVAYTPMALEIDGRDFTNSVGVGPV
jgi:hypothetical protein